MRFNKLSWLCFLVPAISWATGGLVGNGGGLAEQNFMFALESLPRSIESCFQTPTCVLTPEEAQALKEIQAVAKRDVTRFNPLVFVSGTQNRGFFDLSSTEPFRIAKTGLDADAPIWINTDLLYKADGSPALDFAAMTAILIHEVGHQTGRTDHAFLDLAGATVRAFLHDKLAHFDFDWLGKTLKVETIDYALPTLSTDVFYSFGETKVSLNPRIFQVLRCPETMPIPLGFKLVNGHWEHPLIEAGQNKVSFEGWAQYTCLNEGVAQTLRADIQIVFAFERSGDGQQLWSVALAEVLTQPFLLDR